MATGPLPPRSGADASPGGIIAGSPPSLREVATGSGPTVRPAAASSRSAGAAFRRLPFSLTPAGRVIAVTTLFALALRGYQLARPGHLLGVGDYDDGTDFGSALRLIHGVLPYRDFVTVQPPGITLLMVPAALLSHLTGTAGAIAAGRILTALAGAAAGP